MKYLAIAALFIAALSGCNNKQWQENPYLTNDANKQHFFATCQSKMKAKLPTAKAVTFGKGYLLKSHTPITAIYRTPVHYILNGTKQSTHMSCFGYHDSTQKTDIYVRYTREDEKHQ